MSVAKAGSYRARIRIVDDGSGDAVSRFDDVYKKRTLESVAKASMRKAIKRARALGATSIEVESNAITPYVPRDLKPDEKVKRWYLRGGTK